MMQLTSFPSPTEGVHHQQADTSVDIDGKNLGNGTLFISESCVVWQREEDGGILGEGFRLEYSSISCHAISRDPSTFPHPCLYLMMDGKMTGEDTASDEEEDEDDDKDSEADLSEIRFIPADKCMLEAMFAAMSQCQALHPDPDDVDSEDDMYDDNHQEEEEEEEEEEYSENGVSGAGQSTGEVAASLSHFADVLHFGQGDGPGPSGLPPPAALITSSGDAWQEGDEVMDAAAQFQDAEDME